MIASMGILLIAGFAGARLASKIHLPDLVGMLAAGILIGPFCLNLLSASFLDLSEDLRRIALIIILIRAGFSLDLQVLKKVGRPALLLSFVPASFEIAAYTLLAPLLLGISWLEATLMGTVMSAVSPAVVVPRMVKLNEEKSGTSQGIPQMMIAGSSCDDVYVLVLFSAFLSILQGEGFHAENLLSIPVSISSGILLGILTGYLFSKLLAFLQKSALKLSPALAVVLVLGVSFLLNSAEEALKPWFSLSGLLAILAMAASIRYFMNQKTVEEIASGTSALWSGAQIFLFVLVGAAIPVTAIADSGLVLAILILCCLVIRSVGTWICVSGTHLNFHEKMFAVFSYLPKATIQAAIGSVPLAAGLACGPIILAAAVTGILITAPLGAFLIDWSAKRWLKPESRNSARKV